MILVTGSVRTGEDSFDETRLLAEPGARTALAPQAGCLSHVVHIHCGNPLGLVFVGQWADMAAHFAVRASRNFVRG